jgi:hypothetical protein
MSLSLYCHFIALELRPSHHQRIYRWGKWTVGLSSGLTENKGSETAVGGNPLPPEEEEKIYI